MAYFNHAFTKMFLGTGTTRVSAPVSTGGFLTGTGVKTADLSLLTPGYFGLFDATTYATVAAPTGCCPLILASSSLMGSDKIGPYHGGYKETNKSKVINPRFVQRFYRVDPCTPQQAITSIGTTPYTGSGVATLTITDGGTGYTNGVYTNVPLTGGDGTGVLANITVAGGIVTVATISTGDEGQGYVVGDVLAPSTSVVGTPTGAAQLTVATLQSIDTACSFEFLCGETYYLRVDIKGSPALRFANHNVYQNLSAYTGCCTDPVPSAVDSTLVMIQWAQQIVDNAYMTPFIFPVVYDEAGNAWYPPNSTLTPLGVAITPAEWWSAYVSAGHTPGATAGLRLFGAYVDTQFGNCSFQLTDFFEKEPIQIYASLVDLNGDPCIFEGICVYKDCLGMQGMGFGDTVVKDLIKAESYLQNFFSTDFRIREITQGDDILNSVTRNALYYRYFILHSVPRYNNPSGTFDNDRYMLEIITTATNAAFEAYMTTWLGNCPNCVALETHACTPCTVLAD